jgi:hypothetical protein
MNGTALSDAFSKNSDYATTPMLHEIEDENIINNYWNIIKGSDSKQKFDSKSFYNDWFGDYQQMMEGLVYLPLNSLDPTLGIYSGGDKPTQSQIDRNKSVFQQQERIKSFKPQGNL